MTERVVHSQPESRVQSRLQRGAEARWDGNGRDAAHTKPAPRGRSEGTGRVTLAVAPARQDLRVRLVSGENGHAQRLRELGLYEGQTVQVLLKGDPLICRIGDCRVGMCHSLACGILVEPVTIGGVSKRSA